MSVWNSILHFWIYHSKIGFAKGFYLACFLQTIKGQVLVLLNSIHFKNTETQSSNLSKLRSFSIIDQLTLVLFQLMLYWKLSQFQKKLRIVQLFSKNGRTLVGKNLLLMKGFNIWKSILLCLYGLKHETA